MFWARIRSTFFVGILAAAPLALTFYVFVSLFHWFDELFQPIVRSLPFFEKNVPGLGVIVGMLFIFVVGVLAPSLIGKQLLIFTERIMERVPLAKLVYSGTKQIFDSFSSDSLKKFSRVVLIEFPRDGLHTIAFATRQFEPDEVPLGTKPRVAVFVPTTPNPTSGYLVFIEAEKLIEMDMTVEDALKLIISGGLVKPGQH